MAESHRHSPEYEQTSRTETKTRETLSLSHFDAQADYISMTISSEEVASVGMQKAKQEYVENEPNAELRKFGKLLLLAPWAAGEQAKMDQILATDGVKRKHGMELTDEEVEARKKSAFLLCSYNQLVESLVADHEDAIPPNKLESWLSRASGNNTVWAAQLVSGVKGERAGEKLLAEVDGITGLMHGDVDQDLKGQDFVFDPMGDYMSVDVKTGRQRPKLPVTHDSRDNHLVLSINPLHLDSTGYAVDKRYVSAYLDELTAVLAG